MKIGLVGFGAMGKAHAYAIASLPYYYHPLPFEALVKGVCTSVLSHAESAAASCGFPRAYAAFEEMLADPEIDAVCICTPNHLHYTQILACLKAGKAIYCEKPLCITPKQAWEVAALAEKQGITAQIVFQNRYLAAVMKAKKLITEGRLGRILTFRFSYLHASCTDPERNAGWKQDGNWGGGVLFDLGSHVLDLCTHLCGVADSISGCSQIAFPERKGRDGNPWTTNADEAFYMTLKMRSGAIGMVEASKLATGTDDALDFSIHGERGALRFSLMDSHYLEFYDRSNQGEDGFVRIPCGGRYAPPGGGFPSPKAASGWLRGHVASMYEFLSAVHEKRPATPNFAQGAYVQTLMAHAMQSDRLDGRFVRVSLTEEEERLCSFLD